MTNCIIVHGCPSNVAKATNPATRTYDKHWIPWLKEQLTAKGIAPEVPLMPAPWEPNYDKFKQEFAKLKDQITKETILIGHSCGCAFLVRWLGDPSAGEKQSIKKLILVAPWKISDTNDEARKDFYEYPIDSTIKDRINEIVMFTADDEEEDGKKSLKIFHNALGGQIINLPNHGHYTQDDMGTTQFPELLGAVTRKG